jgi:AraC family transcriptional regulator
MEHIERPSLALSTLCVGQQKITASSARLGWNGFVMERQVAGVEMTIGNHSDHDMIAMVTSNVMRGEYTSESGRLSLSQKRLVS